MTALETTPTFQETTLTAGDLTLRPLTESDADDVAEACQDPETLRWLPIPRPYTLANAKWFILRSRLRARRAVRGTGIIASQRAAEKAGFMREGVARNAGYVRDGRVDLVLFSLVPGDLQR